MFTPKDDQRHHHRGLLLPFPFPCLVELGAHVLLLWLWIFDLDFAVPRLLGLAHRALRCLRGNPS